MAPSSEEDSQTLRLTQKIGYAAIIAAAGLSAGLAQAPGLHSKISSVAELSAGWVLSFIQLVNFSYSLALAFLWWLWTDWELDLLTRYLPMPPYSWRDKAIAVLGGAVLGFLIYFYDKILVFTSMLLILDIFNWLGVKDVTDAVNRALSKKRRMGAEIDRQIVDALYEYYVRTKHRSRIALFFVIRLAAFAYAFWGRLSEGIGPATILGDRQNWQTYIAYGIIIISGIASEIWIFGWRVNRERVIKSAELYEYEMN